MWKTANSVSLFDRREISYWFDGAQGKVMWKTANSVSLFDRREISYWFDGAQGKVIWKTANSLFVSASVSQYPWADVKRPSESRAFNDNNEHFQSTYPAAQT